MKIWRQTNEFSRISVHSCYTFNSFQFQFAVIRLSQGSLFATGYNWFGECNVPPGDNYIAVTAGWQHSLALKDDSTVIAWGYNQDYGQCNIAAGYKIQSDRRQASFSRSE